MKHSKFRGAAKQETKKEKSSPEGNRFEKTKYSEIMEKFKNNPELVKKSMAESKSKGWSYPSPCIG